jgi:uncharacterized protein (TIGR02757 family)
VKIFTKHLKRTLDRLYQDYSENFARDPHTFFERRPDPILFPHRYTSFHDREAAAFIAATFAYGNVRSLCRFIDRLLDLMRPSPHAFLLQGEEALEELASYRPYYRLHKTSEIVSLLSMLSEVYRKHGSLYELFLQIYQPERQERGAGKKLARRVRTGRPRSKDCSAMSVVLCSFVNKLHTLAPMDMKFLVPSPADGSPCKRLNLFLRWMVRRKDVDFGIWSDISPAHLIMPLDTHIGRVAYRFGWIDTPSLSWRKAETITGILREFDVEDPLRYDFALCHESIQKSPWLRKLITSAPRSFIRSSL